MFCFKPSYVKLTTGAVGYGHGWSQSRVLAPAPT